MEPRKSENAFEPLREAAVSDSILTHPALERIAFDQIRTFTLHPEAAIALANAFGVQGEFE